VFRLGLAAEDKPTADLHKSVNRGGDLRPFIKEEIALCARCGGTGEIQREELADYHHREYNRWLEPCDECNSTGRIYKQTLSLTGFRPFKEAGDGN